MNITAMPKKKIMLRILGALAALLLAAVYVLPVRCTPTISSIEFNTDAGMPYKSQTCYSIYHEKFWTEVKDQPLEFVWGGVAMRAWFNNHELTGTFAVRKTIIHHIYPADFSDNKILMGASHNVFVGKVVAQVGEKNFMGNPATQFSVQVIGNIKGETKDTVIVNQEGGLRDGILYIVEEDGKMLEPDSTYLFATRYDQEGDYYTLNPHENASKLLSNDANLDQPALQALSDQDVKVKTLESAYPNEILLDADIAHQNTRNAFRDLPPESKAAAQSRADVARASLEVTQHAPAIQ